MIDIDKIVAINNQQQQIDNRIQPEQVVATNFKREGNALTDTFMIPIRRTNIGVKQLMGKDVSNEVANAIADIGIENTGALKEPNWIGELVAGATTGFGSQKVAQGLLGAFTRKSINPLVESTMKKALIEDTLATGIDSVVSSPRDIVKVNADKKGVKTGNVTAKDYIKAIGANFAGDSALNAFMGGLFTGIGKLVNKKAIDKLYEGADTAIVNIDEAGLASINKELGKANISKDGFIDINKRYTIEQVQNFETKVKSDNDKAILAKMYRLAGDTESSEKILKEIEQKNPDVARRIRQDENIDTITAEGAYRDGDKFVINTPKGGSIRGKIVKQGGKNYLVADLKSSKLTSASKSLAYGNNMFIEPKRDPQLRAFIDSDTPLNKVDEKRFTDFEAVEIGEDGNLKVKEQFKNKVNEDEVILSNPILSEIQKADIETSFIKPEGTHIVVEPDPIYTVINADKFKPRDGELEELKTIHDYASKFKGAVSVGLEKFNKTVNVDDIQPHEKDLLDTLFNYKDASGNEKIREYYAPKKEFKKAIDTAYALNLAKTNIERDKIPKDMAKKTVDLAFDLMGIKPSKDIASQAYMDTAKKDIAKWIQDETTIPIVFKDIQVDPDNPLAMNKKAELSDLVKETVKSLGETPEAREIFIREALANANPQKTHIYTNKYASASNIKVEASLFTNKYYEQAVREAKTPYRINTDYLDEMNAIFKPLKDEGIVKLFSKSVEERASNRTFLGMLKLSVKELRGKDIDEIKKIYENAEPSMRDTLDDTILTVFRELEEANAIHKNLKNKDLYFSTKIANVGRPTYMNPLNPKSLIGQAVLRPKSDITIRPDDTELIEISLRGYAQLFGLHSEFKTINEVESFLEDAYLKLKKDRNDPLALEEGLKSYFVVDEFIKFYEAYRKGEEITFNQYLEVDAKQDGLATNFSKLGILDETMGIGTDSIVEPEADLYMRFAEEMNIQIERSMVKPAVFASLNEAHPYNVAKALAETLVDEMRLHPDVIKREKILPPEIDTYLTGILDKANINIDNIREFKSLVDALNLIQKEIEEFGSAKPINEMIDSIKSKLDAKSVIVSNLDKLQKTFEKNRLQHFEASKLYYFIDALYKLHENERLTQTNIDALVRTFADVLHPSVEKAIKKVFPEELRLQKELTQEVQAYLQTSFAIKYFAEDRSITQVKEIVPSILKDANKNVTKDVIDKAIDEITRAGKRTYSLYDIVDKLGSMSLLSPTVVNNKYLKEIIPKGFNGIDVIATIKYEGYAGYNDGVNFGSMTPHQVIQPIFTITTDASIMARSFQDNATSIYDAIRGNAHQVLEWAKKSNAIKAKLLVDDKPHLNLKRIIEAEQKELDNYLKGTTVDYKVKDRAFKWLAQQELLSKNKPLRPDTVDNVKKKFREFDMSSTTNTTKFLTKSTYIKFSEMIEANKKSIDEFTPVSNNTNGTFSMSATKDMVNEEFKFNYGSRTQDPFKPDFSLLRNIEPAKGAFKGFKSGASTKMAWHEPSLLVFNAPKSEYANNTIYIKGSGELTPKTFQEVLHEVTHKIFSQNPELYSHLSDAIKSFEFKTIDGKPVDVKAPKSMINEERISALFHRLFFNELMYDQRDVFARAFKTDNLEPLFKENALNINGKEVYTLNQLYNILPEGLATSEFTNLRVRINGELNTSTHIRDWFEGKKPVEFESTLKDTFQSIELYSNALNKLNNEWSKIPVFEMFRLSTQKEGIETALALTRGQTEYLNKHLSQVGEEIDKIIQKTNHLQFDKDVGNAIMLGMNLYKDKLDSFTSSKDFIRYVVKDRANIIQQLRAMAYQKGRSPEFNSFIKRVKKLTNDGTQLSSKEIAYKFLRSIHKNDMSLVNQDLPDMMNTVEKLVATYRIEQNEKLVGQFYSTMASANDGFKVARDLFELSDRYKNTETLFGMNPEYNFHQEGKRGYLIDEPSPDAIGTVEHNGKTYYLIPKESKHHYIGQQSSQVPYLIPENANLGLYELKLGDANINFYPQNIKKIQSPYIDTSASKMIKRNIYAKMIETTGNTAFHTFYSILKKEGMLLSKERYMQLPIDERANYQLLGKTNRITRFYGDHYISNNISHYLKGTDGMDLKPLTEGIFGKQVGSILTSIVNHIVDATRILKGTILTYHLSSYINSAVSSTLIYATHGNILDYKQNLEEASRMKRSYALLLREYIQKDIAGEDTTSIKQQLDAHEFNTLIQYGLTDTIRQDSVTLGTFEEGLIYRSLNKVFKDRRVTDAIKTVALDPSTTNKKAQAIMSIYDATELLPKLALYLDGRKKNMSQQQAITRVLMAFPTYNNLYGIANLTNLFSPYTKYAINYPKMMLYALNQSPFKIASLSVLTTAIPQLSWKAYTGSDEDAEWYQKNGFMYMGFGYAWYYKSADPTAIPTKGFQEEISFFDPTFLYEILTNGGIYPDITPFKKIEQ